MAYTVNTSKEHRLPHNFFENLYENIPALEDIVLDMQQSMLDDPDHANAATVTTVTTLNKVLVMLKRQRLSHRGMEEL